nr:hypothetical protein [Tanacetum cinerariifolium]
MKSLKEKPHYNELNKVAIGYKNPLCLTHAKLVQPTLYNGHEIIKDNHTPTIVHNAEETLEIAEITRKKMIAKMNDPECVTRKVKEYQEKDKIGSKPDKNGKHGEARKSQKKLQSIKQEKLKKTQKEGPEMQIIQALFKKLQVQGLKVQFPESSSGGAKAAYIS